MTTNKNFARRYAIARTITYTCLVVAATAFVLKAYSLETPEFLAWVVLFAAIIGVPYCFAMYYYKAMRTAGLDADQTRVETLAAAAKSKNTTGKPPRQR